MDNPPLTSNWPTCTQDVPAGRGRPAPRRHDGAGGGRLVHLLPALAPLWADACLALLAPPTWVWHALAAGVRAGATDPWPITAGVAVAAWAIAGWLTLCVAMAAAARLPGTCGRAAKAAAERITPGVLRRLVSGGAAASVALAFLPAVADAGNAPAASCRVVSSASGLPSVDRPLPPCPTTQPSAARFPWVTRPSATRPPLPRSQRGSVPAARTTASHVVVAGDSLWSLAQAQLTRPDSRPAVSQVAARWPAWWAANRAEIGPDPGLLRVGEVLHIPTAPTA